ncbi:MAG: hypothetical protein N2578_01590, partial [Bdellovibrionaceae bacterium]|nr:hypothetical protein [Pseudobdellovibrionaceae bacterium]
LIDQFDQRGVAYGFDLSATHRIPGPVMTILAVNWQDVGDTSFMPSGSGGTPDILRNNLSAGVGFIGDYPGFDFRTGIEYRRILNTGIQSGKKLHLGLELGLPLLDLQIGLNQGYPSYGVGIDLGFLHLQTVSYTEEAGVYPGQTPQSRLLLSLSMGFSVDADFSMNLKDGKRRKLKKRR